VEQIRDDRWCAVADLLGDAVAWVRSTLVLIRRWFMLSTADDDELREQA
jgi:hypothetical protein